MNPPPTAQEIAVARRVRGTRLAASGEALVLLLAQAVREGARLREAAQPADPPPSPSGDPHA